MLLVRLDGDGPLHRQTYRALRDAILAGRLRPGERLASTRELADALSVSRNTVLQAYDRLLSEGYAVARPASGTYVADSLPAPPPASARGTERPRGRITHDAKPPRLGTFGRRIAEHIRPEHATWSLRRDPLPYDFRYGEPAYADLPLVAWARLLGRRARRLSVRRLAYQQPGGATELREALAGYLTRSRGVACAPEQILVVRGTQQAVDLAVRLLVDPGQRVVLEEPRYTGFSFCATALGAELVHVPVDEHGLQVERLDRVRWNLILELLRGPGTVDDRRQSGNRAEGARRRKNGDVP